VVQDATSSQGTFLRLQLMNNSLGKEAPWTFLGTTVAVEDRSDQSILQVPLHVIEQPVSSNQ